MHPQKHAHISILITAILAVIAAYASPAGRGLTPVRNFVRTDYGAGAQNWCAIQDSLGRMYFGNQYGLLSFDGSRWNLDYLPNYSTVRSLHLDYQAGKIYAGGSNEFGYFTSDSINGLLTYKSLVATLPEADRNFTEIWNIFDIDGKIWFQGDFALYRYDGNSTVAFPFEEKIVESALAGSRLYVALQSGRLMRFNGTHTEMISGSEILYGKKITGILPWRDNRSLLIATSVDGLYLSDGTRITQLNTDADDFLKANQIFCAEKSGDEYIFGTVNNGVAILNSTSGSTTYINRRNGMQNNTVLATHADRMGNIWLMLDNGIDYALHISPIRNLISKFDECGAGYSSIIYQGRLYLGTNQGLYVCNDPESDKIDSDTPNYGLTPNHTRLLKGQIWSMGKITAEGTDYLFVAGDAGIFYYSGGSFKAVGGISGAYKVLSLKGHPGEAIASTYTQFHHLKLENGVWRDMGRINGYDDIGGDFLQAPDGKIWIAHWMKGVFRLTLSNDASSFVKLELFDSRSGLPTNHNNSAALINGKVVISSEGGMFTYDSHSGRLLPDRRLNKIFGTRLPGHLHAMPNNKYIKVNRDEFIVAHKDINGAMRVDSSTFRSIADKMIPGFEHLNYISPREVIVTGQEGFWCIDLSAEPSTAPIPSTFISAIHTKGDSTIYRPAIGPAEGKLLKVPYDLNSLKFDFACPDYTSASSIVFSSMLENYDKEWSSWSHDSSREYTRLSEGEYILRVRTRHLFSGNVEETAFRFRILPPWYRSPWAYVIYTLIMLAATIFIWHAAKQWKEKAQKTAEERKEKELQDMIRQSERETLMKDHEITLLKSERLEHDILHKSRELGNTTMNLIRKNEILNDIAAKITKIQELPEMAGSKSDIHKQLQKIRALIKENISHDDDWKTFTENFDVVYHDYTKRLHSEHPELSTSDLRLCCYIKMGLSSKEIAPLINISYKSVEMSRYRLRKKMGLERETSLTDYLQNF